MAYEKAVKNYILDNSHFFVRDSSQCRIYFEKAICFGNTITDCLMFDKTNLEIGIEIKTKHDTTKRLAKQLTDYCSVCDYVWVLVHESLLSEAENIINKLGLDCIGIISYIEIQGEIIGAVYKPAYFNNKNSIYLAYQMLWSTELKVLTKALAISNGDTLKEIGTTKSKYIKYIVNSLGKGAAKQYLIDFILSGQGDPNKVTNEYKFANDGYIFKR